VTTAPDRSRRRPAHDRTGAQPRSTGRHERGSKVETTQRTFDDIAHVKAANRNLGHYFFERDTMRFFQTRIGSTLYGGRYFVTSERDEAYGSISAAWDGQRRYTVRRANGDGSITTVGEFGQYASSATANAAADRMAREEAR